MSDNIVAEIKKEYIYDLAKRDERVDGRALDQYRNISIETGIISKAEGSARVQIGDTQVLVGVKIQPGEPFSDTPDKGVIITNAELIPLASPTFESGPPREGAIELARVVDRGIRESGAIDLAKLCIEEGVKVWMVFIDVHVLDHDGNLIDAAALGAIAALLNAKLPNERYDMGKDVQLLVEDVPVAVTVAEIGGKLLVDPCLEEGQITPTKLTIIFNKDDAVAGMQKSGTGMLTSEQVYQAIEMASKKSKEIRKKFLKRS
ncbi:MAG: exosome complex protein Rrp42 [Methanosarcinales archaeon]|nr:MAG: exosome complex protein Rrp42 [Methanosarcinales archaeon]